jgi:hypothetical protein
VRLLDRRLRLDRRIVSEVLTVAEVRRLALARAGLLAPALTGFPRSGRGRGKRAREAALAVIRRFGYLQLDTVSIAGARSHGIVLLSRLEGFDPALAEELLQPGEPLFEYWGHEASWIPLELYPAFEFRRRAFRRHPWWGDVLGEHPEVARRVRRRIRDEGPLRSVDLEGPGGNGWWDFKIAKRVATALWSSGELAIRERRGFQRTFDLAARVIPEEVRDRRLPSARALETLILAALDGHGWASTPTIAATWRLRGERVGIAAAMARLVARGEVVSCGLERPGEKRPAPGWIRPRDLELVGALSRLRPRRDRGVLLSPFDPVLWDRARVKELFGFDQILEIFKPAPRRVYGYYCLPVLAGDRLIARVDLKADRKRGLLRVLSCHFEGEANAEGREATRVALDRYAKGLRSRVIAD